MASPGPRRVMRHRRVLALIPTPRRASPTWMWPALMGAPTVVAGPAARSNASTTGKSGGDGAAGVVIVTEYYRGVAA